MSKTAKRCEENEEILLKKYRKRYQNLFKE